MTILAGAGPGMGHWGGTGAWGDQGDGTFRNPVLPADYSDIDCIRVGSDFYAISSTFQFSPGMAILRSRDLVNWTTIGHAVADVTQIGPEMNWDRMNRYGAGVWAGALRHHAGRFWVFFGTPDEGYFVTSAADPSGPWEPLTPLLRGPGWDDCCPFWDDDGQGYLIGSRFAPDPQSGKKYNIHLWKLTRRGTALVPGFDVILHQSAGSEANKLYKWDGIYYHYFSEVRAEGRVPMMGRSRSITGPYEYRQLTHVNRAVDREPNQGGFVRLESGAWYFFTHHGAAAWEGRSASLLPVTWVQGWPVIGDVGADGIGSMVWAGRKPVQGQPRVSPAHSYDFSSGILSPSWEWNYQPRRGWWSLQERPGWLRLRAFHGLSGDNLLKVGNVLTQRSLRATRCEFVAELDLSGMADGQHAGVVHFSAARRPAAPAANSASLGVVQRGKRRLLEFSRDGRLIDGPVLTEPRLWIRSQWGLDGISRFAFSTDGVNFVPFGEAFPLAWGSYRGDRVGLFTFNNHADQGYVDVDTVTYQAE